MDGCHGPFEPATLHPRGRHAFGAGEEVERRAHAQLDAADVRTVLVGELLLLRATEADEDETGSASVDPVDHRAILFGRERPEGRRLGAGDPEAPAFEPLLVVAN